MTELIPAVLVASFLGSLHCAGMCGPFVVFYAGSDTARGWRALPSHLAYNLGRLATYSLLGAALGAVGGVVDATGAIVGIRGAAALGAGALLLAWGGMTLLAALRVRLPLRAVPAFLRGGATRAFAAVGDRPPVVRALLLGFLSALLPCGWLWAFALLAVGTGEAAPGALVMAAFWAGTVPVLAGVGAGARALAGPLRRRLPVVSAILLIVVGLLALAGRLGMPDPGAAGTDAPATIEDAVRRANSLDETGQPCPRHATR